MATLLSNVGGTHINLQMRTSWVYPKRVKITFICSDVRPALKCSPEHATNCRPIGELLYTIYHYACQLFEDERDYELLRFELSRS